MLDTQPDKENTKLKKKWMKDRSKHFIDERTQIPDKHLKRHFTYIWGNAN